MGRANSVRGLAAVIRALKLAKPHSVVAVDREGTETPIKFTGERTRYERVARSILSVNAVQFRCLDDAGAMTEVVKVWQDEDATDDAPSSSSSSSSGTPRRHVSTELAELMKIHLDALDKRDMRNADLLQKVTNAAVETMQAAAETARHASERAGKFETMLTSIMRKRELELADTAHRLEQGLEDLAANAAESDDKSGMAKADELMGTIIDMALESKKKKTAT